MAKNSTQTFYGTNRSRRNQTHKTRRQIVKEFVDEWVGKSKNGIIKEDANRQPFIDDLLRRVCGIEQPTQYIQYEKDVQVKADGEVTTRRIDGYIPSTKVMWEMKGSNKKDLTKPIVQSGGDMLAPYEQAKRYANFLPQNEQPRWIVVSNFLEIDIHDMNKPLAEPKVIMLEDLTTNYKALDFMVDTNQQQIIDEKQLSVDAGNLVAKIYDELAKAYSLHADINDPKIQSSLNMLIVRLVFLLYADDTGILGQENMFQKFLERREPRDIRPALITLFKTLDEDPEKGERDEFLDQEYLQFKYVNGGMFSDKNVIIPQFTQELKDLIVNKAGKGFNWSNISPTIFGAVFESTLNSKLRREGGMHYTSIENIHKVIDPLFLDDLRSEFDKIQNMHNVNQRVDAAMEFQDKIANLKFMDPACGSGNFLTETYLSLRKLENECLKIIVGNNMLLNMSENIRVKVKIQNFYGIEINDFAVSVARTAMWIAESQMWDKSQNIIYSNEDFLPLDSNDSIYEGNALRMAWTDIVKPYELNYIMGNPPFIGYSHQSKEQKEEQAHIYSDQGNQIGNTKKNDYVSNWYMKAANYINGTTIRCAFVSTNSIVQGAQVTSVWQPIVAKYTIVINFAYTSFAWDNEAKNKAHVHVVIIGFSDKKAESDNKYIYNHNNEAKRVSAIGYYLTEGIYPFLSLAGSPISPEAPTINNGNRPTDHGFLLLDPDEAKAIIRNDPAASQYIKRLYGSREFINNKERYCIWLKDASPKVIREHKDILKRVEKVKEFRLNSTKAATRKSADTPWLFQEIRQPESGHYLVLPVTTSQRRHYIPVGFLSSNEISTNALMISTEPASLYDFGVIESSVHMAWMRTVTGRMKSDYQYSKELVYNDFAWPSKTEQSINAITKTAQAILDARKLYPDSSFADLYDPLTMPIELRKAHEANDKAVLKAYGLSSKATEQEIIQQLFGMYEGLMSKKK
ncbi:N-6 DNA methylase [Limosilactobacillus pontis]|uniref:class I SAM-dependent DNA methyltransferase n=1 Tax=Limosilactobacillus pontis TaxID=35787 RepID=UPI0025A397D2|nr:DNA methyltransferase [Limosilactobacillus pontis]MDM8332510.1 N-6 DNA methylase [Limosilactobacillus pontis]